MSEFKSDYYEYSTEWAWEYEAWAEAKIAELKAENDRLQAELQRHKFAIGRLYKCFREKEPTPSAWVDEAFALKEVEK